MIVVVGSVNWDLTVRAPHLPQPGETVLGYGARGSLGGKGANQAVAARRAGGRVHLVGLVGRDAFGHAARAALRDEGLGAREVDGETGLALIGVDDAGRNSILLAPGVNRDLAPADVTPDLGGARVVLMQLEVPVPTVLGAARAARSAGALVLLNASPVPQPAPPELLGAVDVLIVNEIEAGQLLGREGAADVPRALDLARALQVGVPQVVVTLGAQGAVWRADGHSGHVPAFPVTPVDTTGAGDAFAGALAVALHEGWEFEDAVRFAGAAGTLATTRSGASASAPFRTEIDRLCQEVGV